MNEYSYSYPIKLSAGMDSAVHALAHSCNVAI